MKIPERVRIYIDVESDAYKSMKPKGYRRKEDQAEIKYVEYDVQTGLPVMDGSEDFSWERLRNEMTKKGYIWNMRSRKRRMAKRELSDSVSHMKDLCGTEKRMNRW